MVAGGGLVGHCGEYTFGLEIRRVDVWMYMADHIGQDVARIDLLRGNFVARAGFLCWQRGIVKQHRQDIVC